MMELENGNLYVELETLIAIQSWLAILAMLLTIVTPLAALVMYLWYR